MKFLDNKKISERIKLLIGKRSVRAVAIEADIDYSQFLKIIKGTLPVTENILEKLIKKYKWDGNFILYGSGTNVPRETFANEEDAPYGNTISELVKVIRSQQETIQTLAEIIKPPNLNDTAKNA